jgi:SPP1 family predicted phage head-tail adaptor
MRAGQLRTRITIQRRDTGTDSWGQPVNTWTDVATVWSDFRHKSGIETIKSDAEVSTVRASVRIRWRTGIDAGMRLKVGDAFYEIEAVMPDIAGRVYVDLVCKRVV